MIAKKIAQTLDRNKLLADMLVKWADASKDFWSMMSNVRIPEGVKCKGVQREQDGLSLYIYLDEDRDIRHPDEYGGEDNNPRLEAKISAARQFESKLYSVLDKLEQKYGIKIEVHA